MKREMESQSMNDPVTILPLEAKHLSLKSYAQDIYRLRFFDPEVQAQSMVQSVPLFQDHLVFLTRHLANQPFFYLLLHEGKFLGYLSGSAESAGIVLSLALVKEERGKGLATKAINYVVNSYGPSIWYARMKPNNLASLRCFQKAGFHQVYESGTIVVLRKETT